MGILDHPSSSGSSSQPGQHHHHHSASRGITPPAQNPGYFGIDWAKWFPPVTSKTFLSHYLPASGAVSHTLYTVHLFSPNIISSVFPTGDLAVSNTILFNANVGLGFYVYFRRHLHRVNPWERVEFSVLSSTLFNFGSLLAAVLIKALFPARSPTWLKSLTATVLSGYLLSRAAKYMGLLDTRTSSGRGSVSPARSVLSPPRHTAVVGTSSPRPSVDQNVANGSRRPSSTTSSSPLHLDTYQMTSVLPSTILETPPQSLEQLQYQPMTPSATEASEFTPSEFGTSEDVTTRDPKDGQNFRYLHSYALNNIANHTHQKRDAILRRTTMNQKAAVVQNPTLASQKTSSPRHQQPQKQQKPSESMCFVTPEPSLVDQEGVYYTPPPSRLEVPSRSRRQRTTQKTSKSEGRSKKSASKNEIDELDRILDMVIDHAPLALVPIAIGCWVTGTVPIIGTTFRFIFA